MRQAAIPRKWQACGVAADGDGNLRAMVDEAKPLAAPARAATRGLVAAMAMTGMRTVTTNLGLLEQTPPDAVVRRGAPRVTRGLRPSQRAVVTELAHWAFGAAAGVGFGALPRSARARRWSGPAYGLGVWLLFELALAPALGVRHARRRRIASRAMIALDHVLYGVIVADELPGDTRCGA